MARIRGNLYIKKKHFADLVETCFVSEPKSRVTDGIIGSKIDVENV